MPVSTEFLKKVSWFEDLDQKSLDAIAKAGRDRQRVVARSVVGDKNFPPILRCLIRQRRQLRANGRFAVEARNDDAEPRRVIGQYASNRRAARSISSSEGRNAASSGGE